MEIVAGDALGNQHRAKRFEWERQAAMSGTKVDRSLWMMSPIEVNAYYDPSLNEINLPAAFLQAPYFDQNADDASNYGRLGAFIAHELTSDPHSPHKVRSNATVMHVDNFHTAFATKEGDKLYLKPEHRFHLW
nr:M13-type metalloendopeptidase [uncultured Undibacterium sp.]